MENAIVIIILVVIVGLASLYIYRAKKSGKKCIGCPDGCSCCSKKCECGEGGDHKQKVD